MMMTMKINPLVPVLYCLNFEQSFDFYCNILGFSVVYDRPEAKFAFLQKEDIQLMIEEATSNDRKWLSGPLEYPFGRGINIQMVIKNIDELHETIRLHAIPFFMDMEEKWYRRATDSVGQKQFVIQDPSGYLLRFSEMIGIKPLV
jgi:catechol 2,3-dioxygenase-like lactoylglutathione lyase family enzyme